MATSSFFYGGSTAPEQNTVDELIDALNQKVSAADQDRVAAEQARDRAETAASNAELSESNVAGLAQQAQETLADANEAVVAANAAVAGTAANAATATTKAAEASASADAALASQTAAASSASAASASQTASASSATAAAASQSAAATSASNSASSASAAATSATNSASSATASQASRVASEAARDAAVVAQNAAQSSQTAAASSATAAAGSATTASNAATAAQAAQTAAEAAFDSFDDRYLGAKAVAPTVDNDGNALLTGALYFNNTANQMYAWSGSAWVAAGSTGSGDVVGPASSTDNAIARFDGTTGKLVQNSTATVSDTGDAVFKSVNFNDPVHGSRTLSMSSGRLVVDGDFDTVGTYRFGNGWCSLSGGNADGVTLSQLGGGTGTFLLQPNSTGVVETRSGTNPITFRIYNTYTDASNYERLSLAQTSNEWRIASQAAGTGSVRTVAIYQGGTQVMQFGSATMYASTHLRFGTDNTHDIGDSGVYRPRTGYFGTSVVVNGSSVTSTKIGNWDTAYGWGNHASAGYLTGITSGQVTTALGFTPANVNGSNATGTWGISISGNAATATSATSATSATNATNLVSGGTIASNVTGTTQAAKTSDTTVATTAFVDRLRSLLSPSTGSGGGTAVVGDRGSLLSVNAGVTVPANVFAANDTFTIYNNSASNITITQGASLTLRQVGTANTGNRTLAQRGLATVVFISATEAVISGGGLT